MRWIKRTLLLVGVALGTAALSLPALITWPGPFFAFSLGSGKIVVASDRPIPPDGGERFLRDCERLLDRSPLKAEGQYACLTGYIVTLTKTGGSALFFIFLTLTPGALPCTVFMGVAVSAVLFKRPAPALTAAVAVLLGICRHSARTVASLCAHELTHIIAWEHVGLGRLRVPQWVW